MKICIRILCLASLLTCNIHLLKAQTFIVDTIVYNGNPSNRINLVLLGDGYTSAEMVTFRADAQTVANYFLTQQLFLAYRKFFNFFAVEVVSNESGSDHPANANDEPVPPTQPITSVDNYLETTFDVGGTHRCIYTNNAGLVYAVANTNFPQYDIINVIVNTDYYGGCGGDFAVTSMNAASPEVFVHEFGHTFAGLSDEYAYSDPCSPGNLQYINVSQVTDTSQLVWKNWLTTAPIPTPDSTNCNLVGLYEGAQYCSTNWYRPKCNCKMRTLNQALCPVCKEQHIVTMNTLVNYIDAYAPQTASFTLCKSTPQLFTTTTIRTLGGNTIRTQWYVDNVLAVNNDTAFVFDPSGYSTGNHEIKAVAYDTTALVKKPLIPYQVSWNVNVIATSASVPFTINGNVLTSPYTQSTWYVLGSSTPVSTDNIITCTQPGNYYVIGIGLNNCPVSSDTLFVPCVTGIEDNAAHTDGISVFPNPAGKTLTVSGSGLEGAKCSIALLNLLGESVEKKEIALTATEFTTTFNLKNLESGVYFLQINAGNKQLYRKVVKE